MFLIEIRYGSWTKAQIRLHRSCRCPTITRAKKNLYSAGILEVAMVQFLMFRVLGLVDGICPLKNPEKPDVADPAVASILAY